MTPGNLRVLVVDDDRDLVLTLSTLLRSEGHDVWGLHRAADVDIGVRHFDPDVIVLDIGLPDGSGYALANEIRAHAGSKRPLLIALTGLYRERAGMPVSKAAGIDHFVTKPYDVGFLLGLIASGVAAGRPASASES